jgi:hypothetical protein
MKKRFLILVAVLLFSICGEAQFKPKSGMQTNVADSFIKPQESGFSFFNPNNFEMRHSYSASYMMSGGQGLALQRYTNTMTYQFTPNLNARVDISLQNSPYSTFDYRLQNQFNKISLSRAEINYSPCENTLLRISYREMPYGYYSPYNSWYSGINFNEGD